MSFDSTPGFTQVESFEGVAFNKGIASIGGQHTVSYYGTSNNGTVYVFSKDGRSFKPHVYSLQRTIKLYNQVERTKFTIEDLMSFDSTPGFTQVESFEGVAFNKGIASIGGQHTVSYYGTSNNGTVYVLSKDGRSFKPQVYSLQQTINLYNQVEGTKFTMEDVR